MAERMTLKLNGPGMTSLHKVGLAGLYMTLKAFERNKIQIDELSWKLYPDQVILDWQGKTPSKALKQLVENSFQIDQDSFFRLTGLETGKPTTQAQKHLLYTVFLNTFLKQSKSRELSKSSQTLTYTIDDKPLWFEKFKRVNAYNHQNKLNVLLNKDGSFKKGAEIIGWLYPGGIERHSCLANTRLEEPIELVLCLWFAPVGSIFFRISSGRWGKKVSVALVIPDVLNLEHYALIRRSFAVCPVADLTASGTSDAALRYVVEAAAMEKLKEVKEATKMLNAKYDDSIKCRIITFGSVLWNKQENVRTGTQSIVSLQKKFLDNYNLAHSLFRNSFQRVKEGKNRRGEVTKPEHYFIKTSVARELIADNIAHGKQWYEGFADYISNKERHKRLTYEQKELAQMVDQSEFNPQEKVFVTVCHEAFRNHLGRKFGRKGGANWDTEYSKMRVKFSRCKNSVSLREAVIDFWSRAGSIKELHDHWSDVLPLMDEKNWRKGKDLALLALASYKPSKRGDGTGDSNPVS